MLDYVECLTAVRLQFATVALLTGVAAFFAVRAWGFGERLETGAIAQIDQKDLSGAAISPPGAQLIGFRRSGLKLTVGPGRWTPGSSGTSGSSTWRRRMVTRRALPLRFHRIRIAWPAAAAVRVEEFATPSPAPSAWIGHVRSPVLFSLIRTAWMDLRGPRHGRQGRVSYERCGKYVVNKLESIYV